MLPSVGIFDEPVNLIPNQIRTEKNFREGIALSRQNKRRRSDNPGDGCMEKLY